MLDRLALLSLLEALAAELSSAGVRGEMFIVGGAAMALAYNTRRSTRDIDAVFEPKTVIYQAAERVATERGVDPDWLNDAVKGFLPGHDAGATVLFERPGLAVRIASPRYLLAMKVMAARVERDEDDIAMLAELSGMNSVADVLELVQAAYPHLGIAPRRYSAGKDLAERIRTARSSSVAGTPPYGPPWPRPLPGAPRR